ncbi:DUF4956 domain-containing protein [Culicoidibacter larvae]|uniref:DUF4956 domain-containing protein n=1 Tax=Culicoidibacter larvae TaxID=2579976 RepID=A0A5R8QCR2_9FIRM|nr:DUF4956 domain-containing protein [Culicoidibacter larvae]TLG74298.1 DUF4956 domain-containing protein [Culicoidibacter larvae]
MLDSILSTTTAAASIDLTGILICTAVSLVLGLVVAFVHMYRNTYSRSFILTLVMLPILVQSVIMLVNGNLGTGMAVLGAFSLVRFRSVAGGAREISSIFWAMGIGLATGMGYVVYGALFSAVIAVVIIVLVTVRFGGRKNPAEKQLKIVIPEDLDYNGIFDDIFKKYTYEARLERVKTTNMGSLYELVYHVMFKDANDEKDVIDELRRRNGNLTITCGRITANRDEL